jgi:hypothetical protein
LHATERSIEHEKNMRLQQVCTRTITITIIIIIIINIITTVQSLSSSSPHMRALSSPYHALETSNVATFENCERYIHASITHVT